MNKAIVVAALLAGAAQAQEVREERPWIIHAELFGRGLLGSINAERYLNQYVGVGAGIGYYPCFSSDVCSGDVTTIPIFLSFNPIGNVHSLYASVGAIIGLSSDGNFAAGVAQLGYQLQLHGGFFFRPTLQLYFKKGTEAAGLDWFPWAGLAVGYSF